MDGIQMFIRYRTSCGRRRGERRREPHLDKVERLVEEHVATRGCGGFWAAIRSQVSAAHMVSPR
jgi:hypothetical protein